MGARYSTNMVACFTAIHNHRPAIRCNFADCQFEISAHGQIPKNSRGRFFGVPTGHRSVAPPAVTHICAHSLPWDVKTPPMLMWRHWSGRHRQRGNRYVTPLRTGVQRPRLFLYPSPVEVGIRSIRKNGEIWGAHLDQKTSLLTVTAESRVLSGSKRLPTPVRPSRAHIEQGSVQTRQDHHCMVMTAKKPDRTGGKVTTDPGPTSAVSPYSRHTGG